MSGQASNIDVENASALYEDIKSEFSNIGDKDYFLKNIADPAKRSGLYKALQGKGYDVGSPEDFDKSLILSDAPASSDMPEVTVDETTGDIQPVQPAVDPMAGLNPTGQQVSPEMVQQMSQAVDAPQDPTLGRTVNPNANVPAMEDNLLEQPVIPTDELEKQLADQERKRGMDEAFEERRKAEKSREKIKDAKSFLGTSPQNLLFADEDTRNEELKNLRKNGFTDEEATAALKSYDDAKISKMSDQYIAQIWKQAQQAVGQSDDGTKGPSDQVIDEQVHQISVLDGVKEMSSDERQIYSKVEELTGLIKANAKTPKAEMQIRIADLRDQIADLRDNPQMFYDPLTGKRLSEPTPESTQYAAMVENYSDELKLTDKEQLAQGYFEKWAEYKSLEEMYDATMRGRAASVGDTNPGRNQEIKSAERLKSMFIEAKAEFDAYKRAYLLNEDPAGVDRTRFKMAAQAFAHELIPSAFLPEGVNLAKDQQFVQTMTALMQDKGMELSAGQQERMKHTMSEMVSEGIGGLVGILPKLAVAGELTEAGAAFSGLSSAMTRLAMGTKLDKMLVWGIKGTMEETKTRIAGMEPGLGFGFHIVKGMKVPFIGDKYGAKFQKIVNDGISGAIGGTAGMEAGSYVSAAAAAMRENTTYKEELKKRGLDDLSDAGTRILSELIINAIFGGFNGLKDIAGDNKGTYISDPVKLKQFAEELKMRGHKAEAQQIFEKAAQMTRMKDATVISETKDTKKGPIIDDTVVDTPTEFAGTIDPAKYDFILEGKKVVGEEFMKKYATDKEFNEKVNSGEISFQVKDNAGFAIDGKSVLHFLDSVKKPDAKAADIQDAVEVSDIEFFADRMRRGEDMTSKEDIQFYENNKTAIEAELKKSGPVATPKVEVVQPEPKVEDDPTLADVEVKKSDIAKRIRDNIKDLPEKDLGDAEANKNWNEAIESRNKIKAMSDEELLKEVQKGMDGKLINQALYESYFGMDITAKDVANELNKLKEPTVEKVPEPTGETEIANKKSRSKEESLKRMVSKRFPIKKYNPDGENPMLEGDDLEFAEARIEKIIQNGIKNERSVDDILSSVLHGYAFGLGPETTTIKNFIEDRVDKITDQPFSEFRKDTHKEINEKYNADKSALETKPEVKTETPEKVDANISAKKAVIEEKAKPLLDLLNDGRKPKEAYILTDSYVLNDDGGHMVLVAENKKGDKLLNIIDSNGNTPSGMSANWRTSSHILNDVKEFKPSNSPEPENYWVRIKPEIGGSHGDAAEVIKETDMGGQNGRKYLLRFPDGHETWTNNLSIIEKVDKPETLQDTPGEIKNEPNGQIQEKEKEKRDDVLNSSPDHLSTEEPKAPSQVSSGFVESYSTDGIDHELPNTEVSKRANADMKKYSVEVAKQLGWEHDKDRKGKIKYSSSNIAPAGGDAGFILWKPNSDLGVYVKVGYDNVDGDYKKSENVLWRFTTKKDKYSGLGNGWIKGNISPEDFATKIAKEASYIKKYDHDFNQSEQDALNKIKKEEGDTTPPEPKPKSEGKKKSRFTEAKERIDAELDKDLKDLMDEMGGFNSGINPEHAVKAIQIVYKFIKKGIYSLAEILESIYAAYGEGALRKLFPLIKNAYLGIQAEVSEGQLSKMNSTIEVRKFNIDNFVTELKKLEANEQADIPTPRRTGDQPVRGTTEGLPQGERTGVVSAVEGTEVTERMDTQPPTTVGGSVPIGPSRGNESGSGDGISVEPVYEHSGERGTDINEKLGGETVPDPVRKEPGEGEVQHQRVGNNFVVPNDFVHSSSFNAPKRLEDNINAIQLIKTLRDENRPATKDEQDLLFKFSGFGAIKEIAYDPLDDKYWGVKSSQQLRLGVEKARNLIKDIYGSDSKRVMQQIEGTILSAFYTSFEVIRGMYHLLDKMGFKNGRILEPSAGTGNFFGGMPERMSSNSTLTGVELDPLTADILKNLYQGAQIHNSGFQNTSIPTNYYDVAISNIPFGKDPVFDKEFDSSKDKRLKNSQKTIHSYFFAKAMQHVRPGGIIAFVTSTGVMDSASNQGVRDYLQETSQFLGAIRLPNTAFKGVAGTSVVSDIILVRKFDEGEAQKPVNTINKLGELQFKGKEGKDLRHSYNQYFLDNPDHVLGDVKAGGQYSENDFTIEGRKDQNLESDIRNLAEKMFPSTVYSRSGNSRVAKLSTQTEVPEGNILREGNLTIDKNGNPGILKSFTSTESGQTAFEIVPIGKKYTKERVKKLISVKDAIQNIFNKELYEGDEVLVDKARKELNKAYDTYVSKHGSINSRDNISLLNLEADGYLLSALEVYDKKSDTWKKSDIFNKRTLRPKFEQKTTSDPKEALLITINQYGSIVPEQISKILNKPWEEISPLLSEQIYELPTGGYATKDEYLSGNIYQKLKDAEAAEKSDQRFSKNVADLKEAMPRPLVGGPGGDITAIMGARWVPTEYYQDFARTILDDRNAELRYMPGLNEYRFIVKNNTAKSETYTVKGYDGHKTLLAAMHGVYPTLTKKVYDAAGNEVEVKDLEATEKLQTKIDEILDQYENWLWVEPRRREVLTDTYNNMFNNIKLREYDGSHMTFPGMNTAWGELNPHQKHQAFMIINNNGGIIDSIVGSGKTFVIVAAAMEMRRLGIAKKIVVGALKANIADIKSDILKLYPTAKILFPTEKDFSPANRKKLLANIATNDYDVILLTHQNINRIPNDPDIETGMVQEEIDALHDIIDSLMAEGSERTTKSLIKRLQQNIKDLEARVASIQNKSAKDKELMNWKEIGVDHMMIDESQIYKNVPFQTKLQNIAGMGNPKGSGRAFDILTKVRTIQKLYNADKGTTFLSGTPISNSISELYLLFKVLRPTKMKELGLNSFDAWAKTFAKNSMEVELAVNQDFKLKNRFRTIVNAPELSKLYREITDVRDDSNLKLDKPKGDQQLKVAQATEDQIFIFKKLAEFYSNPKNTTPLSEIGVKIKGDSDKAFGLIVSTIASKASLDARLVNPKFADDPNSKLNYAVKEALQIYSDTTEHKGVQLIFSNLGVPRSSSEKENIFNFLQDGQQWTREDLTRIYGESLDFKKLTPELVWGKIKAFYQESGEYSEEAVETVFDELTTNYDQYFNFDVYNDMKQKLIKGGVPESEIAIIHDYKTAISRQKLFAQTREGDVRIIFGSTEKLGTGVNVQYRIVHLHNMDIPWKPSEIEQRGGRGLRQGAEIAKKYYNNTIPISFYATKGSFDPYRYQIVMHKLKTITDFKNGALDKRELDEGDDNPLAEWIAEMSGNPKLLERNKAEQKVKSLERARKSFLGEKYDADDKLRKADISDKNDKELIKLYSQDLAVVESNSSKADETITPMEPDEKFPQVLSVQNEKAAEITEKYTLLGKDFAGTPIYTDFHETKKFVKSGTGVKEYESPNFKIEVENQVYSKPGDAGLALLKIDKESTGRVVNRVVAKYKGLDLYIKAMPGQMPSYYLKGPSGVEYSVAFGGDKLSSTPAWAGKVAESIVDIIYRRRRYKEEDIKKRELGRPVWKETAAKEWPKETDLKEAKGKLQELDKYFKEIAEKQQNASLEQAQENPEPETDDSVSESMSASPKSFVEYPPLAKATNPIDPTKGDLPTVEFPQLVHLAKELLGEYPRLKTMADNKGGHFKSTGMEYFIELNRKAFEQGDYTELAQLLAHEIGHLWDFLPDSDLKRGNLIGRIHSLHKHSAATFGNNVVTNSEIRKELWELSKYWRPFDEAKVPQSFMDYRKSGKELYADAISVLLVSPGLLKSKAPKFFAEFFENMDKKPEVSEAYLQLVENFRDPEFAYQQHLASQQHGFDVGKQKMLEISRRQKKKIETKVQSFRRQFITTFAPILDKVAQPDTLGIVLSPQQDLRNKLEAMQLWRNDLYVFLKRMDESVLQRLVDSGLMDSDIGHILAYQSNLTSSRTGKANPGGLETVRSEMDMQKFIEKLNEEFVTNPEIEEQILELGIDLNDVRNNTMTPAEELQLRTNKISYPVIQQRKGDLAKEIVQQFHDIVFETMVEGHKSGIFSDEAMNDIIIPNKDLYSTTQRADLIEDLFISARLIEVKGTLGERSNPIYPTIMKMASVIRSSIMNQAKRSFVETMNSQFPDEIQEATPKFSDGKIIGFNNPKDRDKELVEYFNQGKWSAVIVSKPLAEMFNKEPEELNVILKAVSKVNQVFKPLVTTLNLSFALFSNPVRDYQRTIGNLMTIIGSTEGMNSADALSMIPKFTLEWFKSLREAYKFAKGARSLGPVGEEMLSNKAISAMGSFFFGEFDENANEGLDPIFDKYGFLDKSKSGSGMVNFARLYNPVQLYMDGARFAGSVLEYNTKIAAYQVMKKKLANAEAAGFYTRDYLGTPNVMDGGSTKRTTNAILIFSNVILQSLRSDYEMSTRKSSRAAFFFFRAMPMLMIGTLYALADEGWFGEDVKRLRKKIGNYDKSNFLTLTLDEDEAGRAGYLRIPMDDINRLLFLISYKSVGLMNGNAVPPDAMTLVPNLILPSESPAFKIGGAWWDYMSGRNPEDTFYGRKVIGNTEFQAGIEYSLPEMLLWSAQSMGLPIRPWDPAKESPMQYMFHFLPILSKMYRSSDIGEVETLNKLVKEVDKLAAERLLKERDLINEIFEELVMEKGGSQITPADISKHDDRLKKHFPLTDTGQFKYTDDYDKYKRMKGMLLFYVAKGKRSKEANMATQIWFAQRKEAKIMLLQDYRESEGELKYKKLIEYLKEYKIISNDLLNKK